MAVNLGSIYNLLRPGLFEVAGKYADLPNQWEAIYKKSKATLAVERTASTRLMPLAQIKNEGGPITFDNNAGVRFMYNQEHVEIALGYAVTSKALQDNQYEKEFNLSNLDMNKSFAQTKQIYAANVLNNATTYDTSVVGDGKALCATDHPVDGYTVPNRPSVDYDLNENGIEQLLILAAQFRDNAGLKDIALGDRLVVPRQLIYVAERLTATPLRPGTANNDINATKNLNSIPNGVHVMDFLTSPYAWFIRTDHEGLQYMEKHPYELDMQPDFTTKNLLVTGYERYSFNYNDWRCLVGSFPTS